MSTDLHVLHVGKDSINEWYWELQVTDRCFH